ncbi:MAG: DUF2202 domain-containing protein, partial [ANME-2 cluster archaeon]|nr:DUF2202 domain-containing protein [ANME-2 cluster archaeon]
MGKDLSNSISKRLYVMINMKKILLFSLICILMASIVIAAGADEASVQGIVMNSPDIEETEKPQVVGIDSEQDILTDAEIAGLKLMREEEKLARDVYMELYDKWNLPIFNNIANSEQTHTDAVKTLLDMYGIEDPVTTDEPGVFANQELQTLYNSLVNQGSASLLEALIVGATVEDLDIKDLNELNAQTENQDILLVYNNLIKGSRNHMRSFIAQIENNGGAYTAQFIDQSELDEITGSSQESGPILDENSNIIPGFSSELSRQQGQRIMLQPGNYQVSGGKGINIQQQANRTMIQAGGISVDCPLCSEMTQEQLQNGTQFYAKLSNGRNAEIKIMPDTASQTALQRLNLRNCTDDCSIELKEANIGDQVRAVYEVQAQRNSKVFGIFNARMQVQAQVDAETGEIIQVNKPWWAFLAVEP